VRADLQRRATTHDFDEALLTGYLDRMLSQGDRQRVDLHLESCSSCRSLFDTMTAVRGAARETRFAVPSDEQWQERPRTTGSRWARTAGWSLLAVWAVTLCAFLLFQLASSGEPLWEKVAVLGGLGAAGILLVSVLLDRLHDLPTDRYRGVQK
jgi:predicted anti-sigma-YlaC factor YlaD